MPDETESVVAADPHCLFCRIIAGSIPSTQVYRDDEVIAFRDRNPQAPTHALVIPRRHVAGIDVSEAADGPMLAAMVRAANAVARAEGIAASGFGSSGTSATTQVRASFTCICICSVAVRSAGRRDNTCGQHICGRNETMAERASEPVLIVGAGPAGLATAACLKQRKVPARIFEAGDAPASTWRRLYDRLHLHTVRALSGLPGYPMPRRFPRYPSREQVVEYLDSLCAPLWSGDRDGDAGPAGARQSQRQRVMAGGSRRRLARIRVGRWSRRRASSAIRCGRAIPARNCFRGRSRIPPGIVMRRRSWDSACC